MARERVGILGLGLIGGSLALALKGKRGAPEVWGCDRRKGTVRRALSTTEARPCGSPPRRISCKTLRLTCWSGMST